MKGKIVGILVVTLLIGTAILPVVGSMNIKDSKWNLPVATIDSGNGKFVVCGDNSQPIETYEGTDTTVTIHCYWEEGELPMCIWLLSSLPPGAVFDYSGKCGYVEVYTYLNWTIDYCQAGIYYIDFMYGYGEYINYFTLIIIVHNVNRDPTLEVDPTGPINVEPGDTVHIDVFPYDPDVYECGDDYLTFECSDPDHFFVPIEGNPYYDWPTTEEDNGTIIIIIIIVTDSHGGYYEVTIIIIIGFVCYIDLDVVWQTNNNELVPDTDEDKPNVEVPGRCLSLNRGANCLKRIYVRQTVPPNIDYKLEWTIKLIVYEDKTKNNIANKIYNGPKEFWVEGIDRSAARNDQTVTSTIVAAPCIGTSDTVCFTNFEVETTIKTGGLVSPQAENDKRNAWVAIYGNNLGLGNYPDGATTLYGCFVEIQGQLLPNTLRENDFFDDEFYWRQNYDERIYNNGAIVASSNTNPDDAWMDWQDITPSNTGKIFYMDCPADPLPAAGIIKAVRLRFEVWCTFAYHEIPNTPRGDDPNNQDVRPPPGCWKDCSTDHKWWVSRTTLDNAGRNNDYWQSNMVASGPQTLGLNWEWNYKPPDFWLDCSVPSVIAWIENIPIIGKMLANSIAPIIGMLLEWFQMMFG